MSEISYWNAVGTAWKQMKIILFKPFSFEKWITLGFAAWMAGLNTNKGGNFSNGFNSGSNSCGSECGTDRLVTLWAEHAPLILSLFAVILVVFIPLGLLFTWIRSRGKFIFLDNVVHNRAAIVAPWKKYRKQGNSLFGWTLCIGLISLVLLALVFVPGILMAWPLITVQTHLALGISGIAMSGLLLIAYVFFFAYLGLFTYDFIVPLMLKHDLRIMEAWSRFTAVMRPNFGKFMIYGLVRYLLSMGVGVVLLAVMLLTCCCFLLVSLIPYVGTVILLPVFVFYRLVSLEFMMQFGGDFCIAPQPLRSALPIASLPITGSTQNNFQRNA